MQRVTPTNAQEFAKQLSQFHLQSSSGDCPVFDDLFKYCQTYAGGSIDGARKLILGQSDVAINWAGGLHHAKKAMASGFCYVNDIVLAILELLTFYSRVLYVDIDIHHGDGVEEAFYLSDRVMTVSFHKHGNGFFPGTGHVKDKGSGAGKYYAVNFPLNDGVNDQSYEMMFKPVISKVMEKFRPTAIVLQCGADSLAHDRLGCFNLTIKGHGQCVQYMKSFGVPMLVLGGGGYNIRSVARCWAYETGLLLGENMDNSMPYNDYWEYFAPDFKLHINETGRENLNSVDSLEKTKSKVLANLQHLDAAPSVQMQDTPRTLFPEGGDKDVPPDARPEVTRREPQGEYFDHDMDNKMEA